jgi:hypothetical protein
MRGKHAFGKGLVVLVGVVLAGVVAVTAAWTSARAAAPVHLDRANGTPGWAAKPAATTSGPAVAPGTPHLSASRPKAALPEELSFDANGSVVLLRRDGRRLPFVSGILAPRGERQRHLYGAMEWSPDGSKLLVQRWGYGVRALEVRDETGKVVWTVDPRARADYGRWSPDGTRIAFVHIPPSPDASSTSPPSSTSCSSSRRATDASERGSQRTSGSSHGPPTGRSSHTPRARGAAGCRVRKVPTSS